VIKVAKEIVVHRAAKVFKAAKVIRETEVQEEFLSNVSLGLLMIVDAKTLPLLIMTIATPEAPRHLKLIAQPQFIQLLELQLQLVQILMKMVKTLHT